MDMLSDLKRVLRDPDKHLARSRTRANIRPLLAGYSDTEVRELSARYLRGDLTDEVNAHFASSDPAAAKAGSPVFARLSDAALTAAYQQCGPCTPPPPPRVSD